MASLESSQSKLQDKIQELQQQTPASALVPAPPSEEMDEAAPAPAEDKPTEPSPASEEATPAPEEAAAAAENTPAAASEPVVEAANDKPGKMLILNHWLILLPLESNASVARPI